MCEDEFSNHLGKYHLLHCRWTLNVTSLEKQKTATLYSKVTAFPSALNQSSCCCTPLAEFIIVGDFFLYFSYYNRCAGVSHCCFNLQYLNNK